MCRSSNEPRRASLAENRWTKIARWMTTAPSTVNAREGRIAVAQAQCNQLVGKCLLTMQFIGRRLSPFLTLRERVTASIRAKCSVRCDTELP